MRNKAGAARLGFPRGARPLSSVRARERGFTLIITIALMVMLVLLSVGLMSLSIISLRGGKQAEYAAQARANARMALMIAIGELQKNAGPDTRVTARADILDDKNPPVMGVWKSWEGTDHTTTGNFAGRPISPGNYKSKKEERFLRWMVSGDNPTTLPKMSGDADSVALIGTKTLGEGHSDMEVHLSPTQIVAGQNKGAFAWWVGGENQKARLPKPYQPDSQTAGRWSIAAKSHSVADPAIFRMDQLLDDASPALKTVSLSGADFIGKKKSLNVSQEFFYDLSPNSVGLLTNTATGGWRKDLSTLTENWSGVPSSNLPFFRVTPDRDLTFAKPTTGNPTPVKGMIYPWSSYRGSAGVQAIYRQGAVASWENLKEYALMYRNPNMTTSSSGTARMKPYSVDIDGDAFNFIHRIRILPVIARIQWVFSYSAKAATDPTAPAGSVTPGILVNPVITMWNPYNVEITMPQTSPTSPTMTLAVRKPLPVALKFDISGAPGGSYRPLFGQTTNYPQGSSYSQSIELIYQIMGSLTLKPGETRVFSADTAGSSGTPAPPATLNLKPGYRAQGGHFFTILGTDAKPGYVPSGSSVKCDAKFNVAYEDISTGVGIYLDMGVDGTTKRLAYRMTYSAAMASAVYQDLPGLASGNLSTAAATPTPFLSTIFGARTASRTLIPTKGFVQSSPLVNYTAMGGKDKAETTIGKHYLGTNHPANSPFDYSFVEHSSGGDDYLPNASDSALSGYIVSGFNKAKGLSRCVIAEIPTRPLQSLCELQNWDMRYENPIPPYAFNLIGNSDATPLVQSNAVVDSSNATNAQNLQHDDSYCANHIFFDDWFFSSISPDPDSFGQIGRDVRTTYTDFLSGKKSLGNNAYKPIPADAGLDSGAAGQVYSDHVKTSDGWKTIASRLEVEGMFNVNSTSIPAWTALLGHARNQCVPFYQGGGTSWSVGISGKTDHPISRFAVSGDGQAGETGSSGGFPGASEFTGYRVLNDALIARLAEEVVKQVRQRGPFLSLSEFVNRQLSSGDLAIAGTVQAALNEIAKGGGANPFAYLQDNSLDATSNLKLPGEAEYRFPDAANGKSSYGFPGWTRQADVLRPLAPILSARDDTFVIRTHGDARDDNGKIITSATCEAVVQRTRDYVDSKDAADLATPPTSDVNKAFGRRFEVVSFRWLLSDEI